MTGLAPFLVLRLWWKSRALSAYKEGILERFSLNLVKKMPVDLWVHAVSLGEVMAATPLIEAFLKQGFCIVVTTMTPTGANQVKKYFGSRVTHQYVPYDIPWAVKRFYKQIQPRCGVIMETELWPNLIFYGHKAGIPLFLANARLSEKSYKQYSRVKYFLKPILNQFNAIFAQYEEDALRYKNLGADNDRVTSLGSIKFDLKIKPVNPELALKLKAVWGKERQVIMLASTHENEEEQVLKVFPKLQQALQNPLLLIAPRHPERFQEIYHLSQQMGFNVGLRSKIETISSENEVIVLDSLGELLPFYAVSHCAFVGGSLIPLGGHNVLEPIAMKTPVLCGPYHVNFKRICEELSNKNAIQLVDDTDELIDKIIFILQNEQEKNIMIKKASLILESNRGVVEKYLTTINSRLTRINLHQESLN